MMQAMSFFSRLTNLGRGKWSDLTREKEFLTEEGWKQELEDVQPAAEPQSRPLAKTPVQGARPLARGARPVDPPSDDPPKPVKKTL